LHDLRLIDVIAIGAHGKYRCQGENDGEESARDRLMDLARRRFCAKGPGICAISLPAGG